MGRAIGIILLAIGFVLILSGMGSGPWATERILEGLASRNDPGPAVWASVGLAILIGGGFLAIFSEPPRRHPRVSPRGRRRGDP